MGWDFELVAGPFGGTTEGPVWDGSGLLFTHLPSSRILRYDPAAGTVSELAAGSRMTNGLALDRDGTLYGCRSEDHCIARYDADGTVTRLPNLLDGVRHNRPNDLAVDGLGRIWFSDPHSRAMPPEDRLLGHTSVLRLDPDPQAPGGYRLERMTTDTVQPNGVLLSRDERILYVAVGDYEQPARELRAYPLTDDDRLGPYEVLHSFGRDPLLAAQVEELALRRPEFVARHGAVALGAHRGIDGMTLDAEGDIVAAAGWSAFGPGPMVYVISAAGGVLETHPVPADQPANCAFGGAALDDLYLTTGDGHLFRARTDRRGHRRP